MIIEQLYTGCLAQATYYTESWGEAAVIDPLREAESYIKKPGKIMLVLNMFYGLEECCKGS